MVRLVPLALMLIVAALASARSDPAPTPSAIRAIVVKLGSEEFSEREAAGKRLNEIGEPALGELRAASRSDNPEIARRAQDILRKIERRVANEKTLAPTLVELDAKEKRLDDVLADLSKQANCEVVLNAAKLKELADKKITIATGGKVPFWVAVLKVCDAADVQVASVCQYTAPEALPLHMGRSQSGVRLAKIADRAVVLEARGDAKRRPAAVFGAVLVEAVPFPKGSGAAGPASLLQIWPEPRLQWIQTRGVTTAPATDPAGTVLVPEPAIVAVPPKPISPRTRGGVAFVRNPDGTFKAVEDTPVPRTSGEYTPHSRQAVVRFKAAEKPTDVATELEIALLATVRSEIEPLSRAALAEANMPATGTGVAPVEMTVRYGKGDNGRLVANVILSYDRTSVQPAGVGAEIPGANGGGPGVGNHSVHGVRITDADGKPFTLGVVSGSGQSGPNGREVMTLALELHPDKNGQGAPAAATFWGTYAKAVEVPVVLKNVPLTGAK